MASVVGVAWHSKMLLSESTGSEQTTRGKHLGPAIPHTGRCIDKRSARSRGSCWRSQAERPFRKWGVDYNLFNSTEKNKLSIASLRPKVAVSLTTRISEVIDVMRSAAVGC